MRSLKNLAFALAALVTGAVLISLIAGRAKTPPVYAPAEATAAAVTAQPEATPAVIYELEITELMAKNRATLRDSDGDFSDWIEIKNNDTLPVSLSGLYLGDKAASKGWALPDIELAAGEYLLVFASGKDRRGAELHTDFSLSAGETVRLKDAYGNEISVLSAVTELSDCSVTPGGELCKYPTPGAENSMAAYIARQEQLYNESPLQINEVCTFDLNSLTDDTVFDWVELKNVSEEPVNLYEYTVSDDTAEPEALRLPEFMLQPGDIFVMHCNERSFELSSESDRVYLFKNSELVDWVPLVTLPYGGSIGREYGKNGWFFYETASPGSGNVNGCRFMSASPVCLTKEGAYEHVNSLKVELSGPGRIYYTTDGSLPTAASEEYTGPIRISETTPVRAISIEEGGLPSRASTFNFFLNEGHTLPIAALSFDSPDKFEKIFENGWKIEEIPGNLSFYEENGSFSINCGMRLNGETSLILSKKNMGLRFRGAYGEATLKYDLYGGGAAEFQNILLRAGQDYYNTVFRNELCQELTLDFSDRLISQRSRFVALYANGKYIGVYTIKEKTNEAMYAIATGTDIGSAEAIEGEVWANTDMFADVIGFGLLNDMSIPENYERISQHLDIDSLIDWLVTEGITANVDLTSGNIRYVMSTETDGKWRLMHYDLDATFGSPEYIFYNVISEGRSYQQITAFSRKMLENPDFRDRFLKRVAEALNTSFSNESIIAEAERLKAELEPEMERDFRLYDRTMQSWYKNVDIFIGAIEYYDWAQFAKNNLKDILGLSDAEMAYYFD